VALGADGLGSLLRSQLSNDEQVSSAYVAYRGAVPVEEVAEQQGIAMTDVVVYIGPRRHLVQYPLRHGEIFNQVAVFESPKALRGEEDWGTPDELDAAFAGSCPAVLSALPRLWRDRWWRMYDREPITNWRRGSLVLTGDAAHPMLQYLAQGACQAIEDAGVLAGLVSGEHARSGPGSGPDWDAALGSYVELRRPRTAEVQTTARWWGSFWHRDGAEREARNEVLRSREVDDYQHLDWLYAAR
jgi:salicylate hydroxylase